MRSIHQRLQLDVLFNCLFFINFSSSSVSTRDIRLKEICKKYKAMGVHVFVLILTLFAIFASATSLNAGQAKYLYNDLGRLSQVIDETGNVATYTYDSVARRYRGL